MFDARLINWCLPIHTISANASRQIAEFVVAKARLASMCACSHRARLSLWIASRTDNSVWYVPRHAISSPDGELHATALPQQSPLLIHSLPTLAPISPPPISISCSWYHVYVPSCITQFGILMFTDWSMLMCDSTYTYGASVAAPLLIELTHPSNAGLAPCGFWCPLMKSSYSSGVIATRPDILLCIVIWIEACFILRLSALHRVPDNLYVCLVRNDCHGYRNIVL